MENERRKKVWRCQKLQRCSDVSGCMRQRTKEEKWKKVAGIAGLWDIQWSTKNRGMTREAVAMNSREANAKELEWSFEKLETY